MAVNGQPSSRGGLRHSLVRGFSDYKMHYLFFCNSSLCCSLQGMSHIRCANSQVKAYTIQWKFTSMRIFRSYFSYLYERVSAGAMSLLVMIDTEWVSNFSFIGMARWIYKDCSECRIIDKMKYIWNILCCLVDTRPSFKLDIVLLYCR